MTLTREHFDEIVNLLEPHLDTSSNQKLAVDYVFMGTGKRPPPIDYSGDARRACLRIVRILSDYGDIEPNKPALWILLEYTKQFYGEEKQKHISELQNLTFNDTSSQLSNHSGTSLENALSDELLEIEKSWWDRLTEGQGAVLASVVGAIAVIIAAMISMYGVVLPMLGRNETPTESAISVTQANTTEDIVTQSFLTPIGTHSAETKVMTQVSQIYTPINSSNELTDVLQLAESGVNRNDEWTPYVQEFDRVEMVLVPTGCFTIGASAEHANTENGNQICFDEPFWIDKYEVSQEYFVRFGGIDDSFFDGDNLPVDSITWFKAQDFCQLRDARLPTEAEWEYAASGPDGLIYPWGNELNANNAVWNRLSAIGSASVGSIPAGASWVGALDMSGNVWEWVSSLYLDYPYGDDHESSTNNTNHRVLRGGSWYVSQSIYLRTGFRNANSPDIIYLDYGFRCARDFEE